MSSPNDDTSPLLDRELDDDSQNDNQSHTTSPPLSRELDDDSQDDNQSHTTCPILSRELDDDSQDDNQSHTTSPVLGGQFQEHTQGHPTAAKSTIGTSRHQLPTNFSHPLVTPLPQATLSVPTASETDSWLFPPDFSTFLPPTGTASTFRPPTGTSSHLQNPSPESSAGRGTTLLRSPPMISPTPSMVLTRPQPVPESSGFWVTCYDLFGQRFLAGLALIVFVGWVIMGYEVIFRDPSRAVGMACRVILYEWLWVDVWVLVTLWLLWAALRSRILLTTPSQLQSPVLSPVGVVGRTWATLRNNIITIEALILAGGWFIIGYGVRERRNDSIVLLCRPLSAYGVFVLYTWVIITLRFIYDVLVLILVRGPTRVRDVEEGGEDGPEGGARED